MSEEIKNKKKIIYQLIGEVYNLFVDTCEKNNIKKHSLIIKFFYNFVMNLTANGSAILLYPKHHEEFIDKFIEQFREYFDDPIVKEMMLLTHKSYQSMKESN